MISPNFATMLCFVETDALLDADAADLLFGVCVRRSFDRISVDGQLSTNDTAILIASGASGVAVEPETADERLFGEALDALLRQLALMIVADGEGAARVGRVHVTGGVAQDVEAAARAVAQLAAREDGAERGRPELGPDRAGRRGGARRSRPGRRSTSGSRASTSAPTARRCAYDEPELAAAVTRDEVEYRVALPGERCRDRGLLLRPLARLRDAERGVHDMSGPAARRRNAARGAALHPRSSTARRS